MKSQTHYSLLILFFLFSGIGLSQTTDSQGVAYYEITDYPESYTAENVAARMIDGLGFRFYWASEGLREEDLAFKPNEEAREAIETVEHIYDLVDIIHRTVLGAQREGDRSQMDFAQMRSVSLDKLAEASNYLRSGKRKLEDCIIVFQRGENRNEFPFWNNINGPIADAIWHCGQIVSFRRSSGNPFNSKASVFTGKVRQ